MSEEDDADGASGDLARTYINGANTMEQVEATLADVGGTDPAAGGYRYYALDHLGSVRGLFDGSRAAVASAEYGPYGAAYAASGVAMPQAFTGKPYDGASGLHYFPYRYYSAAQLRWVTRDPMEMVDGPNVYEYASGSPLNIVDRIGLYGMCAGGKEKDTCGNAPWHYAILPQQYPLRGKGASVANFRQCCWGHDRCYSCSFVPKNTTWFTCDTAMFACNLYSCSRTFPWRSPKHRACNSIALVLYLGTIVFSRPLFPEHEDRLSGGNLCSSSRYCSFAGN